MRYFIIAGEASGDLHASHLIRSISRRDSGSVFAGMGGDKMGEADCTIVRHYRHMAFMGFVAVAKNMRNIRANFVIARAQLLEYQPDVLILIDYPSFNLRIADFCRKNLPDTKIYYYIPPKVWAWKKRRIHAISRLSHHVFGIFPFEPDFYARYGYKCTYVGNPTVSAVQAFLAKDAKSSANPSSRPLIAILPGSRRSEISHCLPRMLEAAKRFPECDVCVAAAPGVDDDFYQPYLNGTLLTRDTYSLIARAKAAVVNSGTATLETALIGCPQVAVYHIALGRFVGIIRPFVFKTPFFTLVNIIPHKEVIRELLAYLFTVDNVAGELKRLLYDESYRQSMLGEYDHIRTILGSDCAADNAADIITSSL